MATKQRDSSNSKCFMGLKVLFRVGLALLVGITVWNINSTELALTQPNTVVHKADTPSASNVSVSTDHSNSSHEKRVSTEGWKEDNTLQRVPKDVLDRIQQFMNKDIKERPLPPKTPGAFLHIGKAGGSTVTSVLDNPCHSFVKKPCFGGQNQWANDTLRKETHVGALLTYIHTPDFPLMGTINKWTGKYYFPDYDFYVSTLRDPYSKFISIFTWSHTEIDFFERIKTANRVTQKKLFSACTKFYSCFRTPEDFATQLGDTPLDFEYPYPEESIVTENCTNLARATMANKVSGCNTHLYWNTKSILERIRGWNNTNNIRDQSDNHTDAGNELFYWDTASSVSDEPPFFLVIRTEHMNQDFFTANYVLGDPDPIELKDMGTFKRKRIQSAHGIPTNVTDVGRARLCRALLPEYKMYVRALAKAINLSDKDRQTSLELSRTNCPTLEWLFRKNFVH